jgi:DNA-binding transcriptional LysR family regulator
VLNYLLSFINQSRERAPIVSDLVEFRNLKYLIAVAEEGNITRAAKRLYLAQPSLSTQMRGLEEALQVPLFIRDRNGVHATPAAEILITGGRELLKLRDGLIATARALHRVTFTPMRLGFSSFVDHALYEMVCSVHTSLFPECEIASRSGDNVELLLLLQKGEIDAALLALPISGSGFKTYPFTKSRLVVCMKSDDPLARLKEIAPAELQAKLTIFQEPKQHPEAHIRLMEMLDEVGIRGDVASKTTTPHNIQWMVESGQGYALVREGSEMHVGLVTRPVTGVTWTVDSALILGKSTSQKTVPGLIRELRKRLRLQVSPSSASKPPRSVRPDIEDENLRLFA